MTTATDTKSQIIDTASKLMMQRGFNGFSYRDISTPLGVKNAAIHYHFPSKKDLVLALIEDSHSVLRTRTAEFMAYGGPARPQLEGLFRYTLDQVERGRPVCIVGALSVDYDEFPDEVKNANDRFMKDSLNWLTRVLEVGRGQGEFEFKGEARAKAMSILAVIQGGRQLSRIHGKDYLQDLFRQIRCDLGIED